MSRKKAAPDRNQTRLDSFFQPVGSTESLAQGTQLTQSGDLESQPKRRKESDVSSKDTAGLDAVVPASPPQDSQHHLDNSEVQQWHEKFHSASTQFADNSITEEPTNVSLILDDNAEEHTVKLESPLRREVTIELDDDLFSSDESQGEDVSGKRKREDTLNGEDSWVSSKRKAVHQISSPQQAHIEDEVSDTYNAALFDDDVSHETSRNVHQRVRMVVPDQKSLKARIVDDEEEELETNVPEVMKLRTPISATKHFTPPGFVDITESSATFNTAKQVALNSEHQRVLWCTVFTYDVTSTRNGSELNGSRGGSAVGYCFIFETGKLSKMFLPLSIPSDKAEFVTEKERWQFLEDFFATKTIKMKICFEGKNSLKPLFAHNIHASVVNLIDLQIAAWVYDPDKFSRDWSFSNVCRSFLKEEVGFPVKRATELALTDLLIVGRCFVTLKHELEHNKLWDVFLNQEMPVVPIISKMEMNGIGFDNNELMECRKWIAIRLAELERQAHKVCHIPVKLSSPVEIRRYLFDTLKLSVHGKEQRTRGGQRSTDEATLRSVAHMHPLPNIVLEYRHITKLQSTWIDGFDKLKENGRIYTSWRQYGTSTGRLSSSEPNFQNLRKVPLTFTTEEGQTVVVDIRSSLVASPGNVFIAADYSQLEMRLLASIANDSTLIGFFKSEKPVDQVTPQERTQAKRLVYGITYGMGSQSLAELLSVSVKEARLFQRQFLEAYPAVQKWMHETIAHAQREREVRTVFGRRRILHLDYEDRKSDRQAVNTIIQGTASDIVKRAMLAIEEKTRGSPCYLRMNIHDELVYEVPAERVHEFAHIIKNNMEQTVAFSVPLPVEISVGANWGKLTPLPIKHEEKSKTIDVCTIPSSDCDSSIHNPVYLDEDVFTGLELKTSD